MCIADENYNPIWTRLFWVNRVHRDTDQPFVKHTFYTRFPEISKGVDFFFLCGKISTLSIFDLGQCNIYHKKIVREPRRYSALLKNCNRSKPLCVDSPPSGPDRVKKLLGNDSFWWLSSILIVSLTYFWQQRPQFILEGMLL